MTNAARLTALVATLGAMLLLAGPAVPQAIEPGKEGALALIVPPKDGARACYARVYDADHLKAHPRQKVAAIGFRLTYYIHEPDEFFPKGQRNYYFQLDARLRGGGKPLVASGECSPHPDGRSIRCGVECDGGGVIIRQRAGGKVLVDLGATGGIRMTQGCDGDDEEGAVELLPGADDKEFLLSRQGDSACPHYEDW